MHVCNKVHVQSPLDVNNSFISRLDVILESTLFNCSEIYSSDGLQHGMMRGLQDASITVRFDLNSRDDIGCIIAEISDESSKNISGLLTVQITVEEAEEQEEENKMKIHTVHILNFVYYLQKKQSW